MKECEIIREKGLGIQVCSSLSEKEALKWVKLNSPAGTTNNWGMSNDEAHKAVVCASDKNRKHYVFTC